MTAEIKPDTSIATRVTPGAARGSNDFTLLVLTGLALHRGSIQDGYMIGGLLL